MDRAFHPFAFQPKLSLPELRYRVSVPISRLIGFFIAKNAPCYTVLQPRCTTQTPGSMPFSTPGTGDEAVGGWWARKIHMKNKETRQSLTKCSSAEAYAPLNKRIMFQLARASLMPG